MLPSNSVPTHLHPLLTNTPLLTPSLTQVLQPDNCDVPLTIFTQQAQPKRPANTHRTPSTQPLAHCPPCRPSSNLSTSPPHALPRMPAHEPSLHATCLPLPCLTPTPFAHTHAHATLHSARPHTAALPGFCSLSPQSHGQFCR